MEIRNWLAAGLLLVAAPTWIGSIWSYFAGMKGRVKNLLFAWISGFLTVMAASQLILVPLVLRRYEFAVYVNSISVIYIGLMLLALFFNWKRFGRPLWQKSRKKEEKSVFSELCEELHIPASLLADYELEEKMSRPATGRDASAEAKSEKKAGGGMLAGIKGMLRKKHIVGGVNWNVWQVLYLTGALGLILLQAVVAGVFQHTDEDDSRFVVEQVIAVEHGNMYKENPVTGSYTYWDMGEVRKDMISPWTMLLAYGSKLTGIAPATLCHVYVPFYLILLTYGVYALLGMHFWNRDREKVSMFLIFVSALNIFGYFSTHTTSAVLLLRIWQGKALVGALLIPALFYIIFEIMSTSGKKMWYFLGLTATTAAALASGSGITITPVVVGICGAAEIIHTRKLKKGLGIWCLAVPSVIYMLCYLFFWQLVKIYY